MTQQSFCRNLINLRKSKNLSTESCAMVAGISTELYEKMELGFEKVTFEVLEKLAKFYQIDIAYFMEEHDVQPAAQPVQTAAPAGKKNVTYPKSTKAFNILGIIFAAAMLLIYSIAPIGWVYEFGGDFTFWTLLEYGNAIGFMAAFFTLIYIVWALVNQIMMTSSNKIKFSVYGFVESVISITLVALSAVFNLYLLTKGISGTGFIVFICLIGVDLIFAIIRLVLVVKLRKKMQ